MVKTLPMMVLAVVMVGRIGAPAERLDCSSKFNPAAPGNGVEWLEWDKKTREMYVFGFIVGSSRGSHHACIIASDLAPSVTMMTSQCLEQMRTFAEDLDFYAGRITEYYHRYPEDRPIPAVFILPFLSDQDAKPLEEIHRMASNCALFMTP